MHTSSYCPISFNHKTPAVCGVQVPWKRWAKSCCSASVLAGRSRGSWGCRCAPALLGGRKAPPPCSGQPCAVCPPGRRRCFPEPPAATPRSSSPSSAWSREAWSVAQAQVLKHKWALGLLHQCGGLYQRNHIGPWIEPCGTPLHFPEASHSVD